MYGTEVEVWVQVDVRWRFGSGGGRYLGCLSSICAAGGVLVVVLVMDLSNAIK